jgi:hypothetical protein
MARKFFLNSLWAIGLGIGLTVAVPSLNNDSGRAQAQVQTKVEQLSPRLVNPNRALLLSTARMTRFNPAVHGYNFVNTFLNVTGIANITTGGLCAGMVYSALDYYKASTEIPRQTYTPISGTTLHSYLYDRNMEALGSHIDKWIELHNNPFGARNSEFFKWGLQGTGGGRLQELRAKIDAGEPVPLGLKSLSANPGEDHVVLAYGYDMGRYTGDLGANQTDLKIFIYEPNYGAQKVTLVPKPDRESWCYEERNHRGNEVCWRTYFVQMNYGVRAAPAIPPGPQKEMLITVQTGGDDLRGGGDNMDAIVTLTSGRTVRVNNANRSQRWIDGSFNTFAVSLPAEVGPRDIANVQLQTAFRGGWDGDNWNVDTVLMEFRQDAAVQATCQTRTSREGTMRHTGSDHKTTFPFPC